MNALWINAEIATCAIACRAAKWPRAQSRVWEGHIVTVYDRFSILPRAHRNATRRALKRVDGKAVLHKYSNELERAN